jgi:hypothetical protein
MSVPGTVGSRREQAEGRHHASRARTRHDRSFAGQRAKGEERVRNDAVPYLLAVTVASRDLATDQVVYPDHEQQQISADPEGINPYGYCHTTSALALAQLATSVAMML